MAGYENLLAVVYHQGPPVMGSQSMRVKILDVSKSLMQLIDVEFPVSRYSNLMWMDFSKEGQLYSYDSDGQLRALSMEAQKWTPMLDFRENYPEIYKLLWIVGISGNELMGIELQRGFSVPPIQLKSQSRKFKLQIPLINVERREVLNTEDSKMRTLELNEEEI
jgi:hypothetical protein